MKAEIVNKALAVRDVLLDAARKFNRKGIFKSQTDWGVRGDYVVISFGTRSGLSANTTDDVQAYVADALGRKCYCDPHYVPAVAATFRVSLKELEV